MVEHTPHQPKVEGFSLATYLGTGRYKKSSTKNTMSVATGTTLLVALSKLLELVYYKQQK